MCGEKLELRDRIQNKQARIGIIGLGYVGLPLAVEFAKAGFEVTGFDVDVAKVSSINKGQSYIGDVTSTDVSADDIDVLIYAGVCREQFEPATACAVAHELKINSHASIFDLSNACLGVLNGIVDVANRIELGQAKAGLVVSAETAREINENTFRTFEAFGVVTIVYLVIALLAWQLMHRIERAAQLPSFVSGSGQK